jgi:AraC-like DNA-binding protein
MDILLIASARLTQRFSQALTNRHHLRAIPADGDLRAPDAGAADFVIFEPGTLRDRALAQSLRLLAAIGSHKAGLYLSLDPMAIRRAVEMIRVGVRHILIEGTDDQPERLRVFVDSISGETLVERLLDRLESSLSRLPTALANVAADAARRPSHYPDVPSICEAAKSSRRSCDRWFSQTGMSSLRRFITAGRVVQSLSLMRDVTRSTSSVAAAVGATSHRQYASDVRRVTGGSLRDFRQLSDDAALERAVGYVCGDRHTPGNQR